MLAYTRFLGCLVGAAHAFALTPALAQSPTAVLGAVDQVSDQEPAALEAPDSTGDIIVTAQKRSERLQDVPLSVAAVTGAALQDRQINDTRALAIRIPSLSFQQGQNATNSVIRIRGIGTGLNSQGVEPAVSVVIDGVVSARQAQSFSDFADIDRVEVLRGPQGTLFGKNATAGVISIVTSRPSSAFAASVDATVAELDEYRIKGTITGPLADGLSARVSGYYNDVGGWGRNLTTGGRPGSIKGFGVRGKLSWDATDNLNLLLAADTREDNQYCCRTILVSTVNPVVRQLFAPQVASLDNRFTSENVETRFKSNGQTYSLTGALDLGWSTLTSITAFQHYKFDGQADSDAINTTIPIYTGGGANPAKYDEQISTLKLNTFTQEVRLDSAGGGPLTYVAGLFYSGYRGIRGVSRRRSLCSAGTIGQPCAAASLSTQSVRSEAVVVDKNLAAFGQLQWRIVGGLSVIGGLRAQHQTVSLEGFSISPSVAGDVLFTGITPTRGRVSDSDTAFTGKGVVQYQFSRDAQVYASYTRGYKGLGYDTEVSANYLDQSPVLPEHVDAYEVGFKGQTADRVLSFSMAAFRADYTDLQIQVSRTDFNAGIVRNIQTNAGSSRTQGFELDATLRPMEGFSLSGNLAYTKARIDVDGAGCPLQLQAAAPILTSGFPINACYRARTTQNGVTLTTAAIQDLRDAKLPNAPKWRFNVSPRFETDLGTTGFKGYIEGDVTYTSSQFFSIDQDPLLFQQSYTLVDGSLGMRSARVSVSIFVKNLFDKNYVTSLSHAFTLQATTTTPFDVYAQFVKDSCRYFGVSAGYKF